MPAFAAAPADPAAAPADPRRWEQLPRLRIAGAAPANPAAVAAPFAIRKVARSATGVVSYLVNDTPAGFQVTQTTSRMFGSAGAAKRAAERLMAAAGRGVKRLRLGQLKAALRDAELHGKPIPDWLLQAEGEEAAAAEAQKGKGEGKAAAAAEAQKGKGEEAAEAQKGKGEEAAAAPLLHWSLRGRLQGQSLRPPRAPEEQGQGQRRCRCAEEQGQGRGCRGRCSRGV